MGSNAGPGQMNRPPGSAAARTTLSSRPGATAGEIAKATGLQHVDVVRALTALVREGAVARLRLPSGRSGYRLRAGGRGARPTMPGLRQRERAQAPSRASAAAGAPDRRPAGNVAPAPP